MAVVEEARPFTLREAAERVHVAPDTIRRWIKAGIIPAVRVGPGGHYRIRPVDMEKVMRQ